MLTISIAKLKPAIEQPNGATIGTEHAKCLRELIQNASIEDSAIVTLDFRGIKSASASYLKRLLNPFFAPAGTADGFLHEVSPVVVNVSSADLKEDLEDYLDGKSRVLVVAKIIENSPKFVNLLGQLDGAASETFQVLRELNQATALQLYERHPNRTTNQTSWNNRLAQLVEMRIARRLREGRFWIYRPTVTT